MNCEAGDAYIGPSSVQRAQGPARTFCFAAFAELESKRAQEPPEKSPSLPAYPTLVVPSARGDGREARGVEWRAAGPRLLTSVDHRRLRQLGCERELDAKRLALLSKEACTPGALSLVTKGTDG